MSHGLPRFRACAAAVVLGLALVACAAGPLDIAPSGSPAPLAVAIPAADAVVAAFGRHRVVAFGETHGSAAQHEFLRELLADPRLLGIMRVVAVEFGTARHQEMIDRYVAGDAVAAEELARVWTETTQRSGVWEQPVYREFFATIRELNADRAPSQQLRVLLGDPPIDWSTITAETDCNEQDPSCLDHWLFRRDEHFAGVVQAALDAGERVLVIAGAGHVLHHPAAEGTPSISDLLDERQPDTTWVLAAPSGSLPNELRALVPESHEPLAVLLDRAPAAALDAGSVFGGGTVTCHPGPCPSEAPEVLASVADALFAP
jgi:erythromycin esterase-like protein